MILDFFHRNTKAKILPVSYPLITTYSQHAHLLSILTYYDFTYPWIFTNYIQMFINKDYKHNWGDFYFPSAYETRPSDTCQWLVTQKIHRNLVENKWKSVIDFIIEAIDSNNYVHTMLNYYYLPNSERYKILHLHHDIFVYGYDKNRKVLYCSDFFRSGIYSQEEISFSDFTLAFSKYNLTKNPDYLNEMVYLYKFNIDYRNKYKFSTDAVMDSIKCYLNNNPQEYWNIFNYENDKKNMDFGMEIYKTLKNYANTLLDSENEFSIRPYSLLYDHKRIMTLRLEYLFKQGHIEEFGLDNIKRYSQIETQAKTIVNILVKCSISKNAGLIDKAIDILNNIEKEEYELLSLLTNCCQPGGLY